MATELDKDDIWDIRHEDGRTEHTIFPPANMNHYIQSLGSEIAQFARERLEERGIDEEIRKVVAADLATFGVGHLINLAQFGYAWRLLEERAEVPPLTEAPKSLSDYFQQTDGDTQDS